MGHLTDSKCAKAKPKAKWYALTDDNPRGLTLMIGPTFSKWTLRLQRGTKVNRNGKLLRACSRHELGRYPSTSAQ